MTTQQVAERYSCSRKTVYRWTKRPINPFPEPRLKHRGSADRWALEDILMYEQNYSS
ncbi:helix-turn-helix transcriptional regulator [Endozoicomonas ascidiicola]|uniref:helix-turn-helix transcriptional regulator n=1 Tax=Endozoicomonas ascidiicola TaxID=1698521 RepID=UPI003CCC1387